VDGREVSEHRHTYVVIRRTRQGEPFVKQCSQCGRALRYRHPRWVLTAERWDRRNTRQDFEKARGRVA
jgi:hypothetical protein